MPLNIVPNSPYQNISVSIRHRYFCFLILVRYAIYLLIRIHTLTDMLACQTIKY